MNVRSCGRAHSTPEDRLGSGVAINAVRAAPRALELGSNKLIDRKHINLPEDFHAGPNGALVAKAAIEKGLTVEVVHADVYLIEGNGRSVYFQRTMADCMSHVAKAASNSKPLTKHFFRRCGVSSPNGVSFKPRQIAKAVEFMRSSECQSFVLKPTDGSLGTNVFMNIDSEEKLREKCALFRPRATLLIEEQAQGTECRYFAVGDKVVAVAERKPANVVGDGKSTVDELIRSKNQDRRKHLALVKIEVDTETRELLSEQGLSLQSVPEQARVIKLKRVSNISQGGDSVDITDEVHDDMKALAVSALKAIPTLLYAGIDVIAENHRAPLSGQRAVVLELNWYPMVSMHHGPAEGQPRDVAGAIIDHVFFREVV